MNSNKELPLSYERYGDMYTQEARTKATYQQYINGARALIRTVNPFSEGDPNCTISMLEQLAVRDIRSPTLDVAANSLISYLEKEAARYSSDHWRLKRKHLATYFNALERPDLGCLILYQQGKTSAGYRKNPESVKKRRCLVGRKRRLKVVTEQDFFTLYSHIEEGMNSQSDSKRRSSERVCAMLTLCYTLGIRPCEAAKLSVVNSVGETLSVRVAHSKNTDLGKKNRRRQRGIERTIEGVQRLRTICDQSGEIMDLMPLDTAISIAKSFDVKAIDAIRKKIGYINDRLWPGRKERFCLYSLRYSFGSALKKEFYGENSQELPKVGIRKIAGMLGHKSTKSIGKYGRTKSGKSGRILGLGATRQTLRSVKIGSRHRQRCKLKNGKVIFSPMRAKTSPGASLRINPKF